MLISKKRVAWALVLVWMGVIFYMSHQPVTKSNDLSTSITEAAIKAVEKVAPSTAAQLDPRRLNHIVRKNAHFFAYLALGALVLNALHSSGVQGAKSLGLAMVICVLYAVSDEFHQTFVPGRGGQVADVMLDSAGAAVGVALRAVVRRR